MKKYCLLVLYLFILVQISQAQSTTDPATRQLVQQALDQIYNFDFARAEPTIQQIKTRLPHHPINPLLSALYLYWSNFPLEAGKSAFKPYNNYLQLTLQEAEKLIAQEQTRTEGMFFAFTVHGYRAMAETEAGNSMSALRESKKAFNYMKAGFKLKETYPEFYLSTGLYNFYVVQYPEDHPVVRPFMWFFPGGNKETGLQQLETAVEKGLFTRTEALYYLVFINHKYRANPTKALTYSRKLVEHYPQNLLYVTRHLESLTACGRYDEARPYVEQLLKSREKVFLTSGYIFQGIVQEKGEHNYAAAKASYNKALQTPPADRSFTREFYALAYAGLGRIAAQEGNKDLAKGYYKKSLDTAEYKATVQEAKAYLKG